MEENIKDCIGKYVNSYMFELKHTNLSENTIKSYFNTLKQFKTYLNEKNINLNLIDIKKSLFFDFFEYKNRILPKQGEISDSTKKLTIMHLKKFFKHIEGESYISYDFSKILDINIQTPKRKPKALKIEETKKLLRYLDAKKLNNKFIDYRDSFIIKVIIFSGIRREEVLNIKLNDIVVDYNEDIKEKEEFYRFRFIGKGKKEKFIWINYNLLEDEINYLENAVDYIKDYISVSRNGKQIDGSHIWRMIKRKCVAAEISSSSVHGLRHLFASNNIEKGLPLRVVQNILDH